MVQQCSTQTQDGSRGSTGHTHLTPEVHTHLIHKESWTTEEDSAEGSISEGVESCVMIRVCH